LKDTITLEAVAEQHRRLCQMLKGHFAYFGISGNYQRLTAVVYQTRRLPKGMSTTIRNGEVSPCVGDGLSS
jgi:hypothetical protein